MLLEGWSFLIPMVIVPSKSYRSRVWTLLGQHFQSQFLHARLGAKYVSFLFILTSFRTRTSHYPVYGFVNGDFSDRTSAKVGGHKIIDLRVDSGKAWESFQKTQILVYLQQDDGYKASTVETLCFQHGIKILRTPHRCHYILLQPLYTCEDGRSRIGQAHYFKFRPANLMFGFNSRMLIQLQSFAFTTNV